MTFKRGELNDWGWCQGEVSHHLHPIIYVNVCNLLEALFSTLSLLQVLYSNMSRYPNGILNNIEGLRGSIYLSAAVI